MATSVRCGSWSGTTGSGSTRPGRSRESSYGSARPAESGRGRRRPGPGGVGARRRDDGTDGGGAAMTGTDAKIRVVIVDDHAMLRAGLEQLLGGEPDLEVVGKAADGRRGGRARARGAARRRPDGPADAGRRRGRAPRGRSSARSWPTSWCSRRTPTPSGSSARWMPGALGYLLKDAEPDEVLRGIRAVARGESPIDPRAARELLGARRTTSHRDRRPHPARERGAGAGAAGTGEQADRPAARDLRAHREGAPDLDVPADRRRRPHPGGAVGRAERHRLSVDVRPR